MIPETSTPNELTTDVPRAIQFTASTRASRLFLILLIVFVACLLGWLHDHDIGKMNALKAQGRTTLAHVIGKQITQGKSTSYSLEYDFIVDGDWVYGDKNVSEDAYMDTRLGAAMPLTFLPSRPETYELGTMTQERIQARQSVWLWGEFGAFAFFGLLLLGTESTFRRHLSLLRGGSVALGTVTDARRPGAPQGSFHVTYQFMADGRLYSEKVCTTQRFHEQAAVGQALTVLHDPARPSHSIPYRMLTDVSLIKD